MVLSFMFPHRMSFQAVAWDFSGFFVSGPVLKSRANINRSKNNL